MLYSIIIPAKNEQDNIVLCLETINKLVFNKTDYEIIVVDNGSVDNTVAIVKAFGVTAYVKPELSLSELRNYGAKVARGDIFAFLDADCLVDENWLNQANSTFRDPDVGCTGSTPVAPDDGTWVERVWSSFRTRRKYKSFVSWINSSNLIVRRVYFQSVGGFNAKVKTCEDVDICMRLNKICKIVFDPTIKVIHLGEPKTLTKFFIKEIWRGKGSISGLFSHGISLSEIKSLLLPVYYLLITPSIIMSIFAMNYYALITLIIAYLFPAMIFTLLIMSKTRKYNYAIGYFILFLVYANARSIAVFAR
jgi:glycosyltransferase involved in cell wall biosynthesis